MSSIDYQNHNPRIEQQLQTNRRVKEHRHCTQQRIAERYANQSSQQTASDCGKQNEENGLTSTPSLCEHRIVRWTIIRIHFDGSPNVRDGMPYADASQH